MTSTSWSLLSLTELVAAVGDPDHDFDIDTALSTIAETLDAEIAVITDDTSVLYSLGFGRGRHSDDLLLELSRSTAVGGDLPGIGPVSLVRAANDRLSQRLLLARTSGPFTADEVAFVRGLGRVVSLAVAMRGALESERDARSALQKRVDDNKVLLQQLRERQGFSTDSSGSSSRSLTEMRSRTCSTPSSTVPWTSSESTRQAFV